MEIFIFNFLKYLLLLTFVIAGISFYKNPKLNYWKTLAPSIILYSLMEGLRWMRGTDYKYNYDISTLKDTSGDIFYDGLAQILYSMGMPFFIFFILVSFVLIYSLFFFIKDYRFALIPTIILLYAFTMQQSENLMRQYFAISLMLISLKQFLSCKYKYAIIFFILSYLSHSSVIFIIPFIALFKIFQIRHKITQFIVKWIHVIFLILYSISSIMSKYFENILSGLTVLNYAIAKKYIGNETYILKASQLADEIVIDSSYLNILRSFLRNIIVILLGYKMIKTFQKYDKSELFSDSSISNNWLFIPYGLACSGIIYMASLPNLQMEVIGRLGLYLQIFIYFIEGLIIWHYLFQKKQTRSISFYFVLILAITECIWIFKLNGGGTLGLKFVWDA